MKTVKKALMTSKVTIGEHAKDRMAKRGYTRKDLISCIMTGSIVEHQIRKGKPCLLIEGQDLDELPIAMVIGHDLKPGYLKVVTVMPPLKGKFKRVI
ncbi:DUF4258 domain-containing protein [Bacillus infantis]|nr:DUF4258 domain-containing protein [Bacillus infantis]